MGENILIYVAIIEDDNTHANYLKILLLQCLDEHIEIDVSIYNSGISFLENQGINVIINFDIIFLDIGMGKIDGIATAEKIRSLGYKNMIVFTSNFQSRAIEGYKVNAYRYLLKPVEFCDIKNCIKYVHNKKVGDYFQYTYHGVTARIAFSEIICFESMQHYIDISTTGKIIKIKSILKEIYKKCPVYFVRCQRSYIVNSNYIKKCIDGKLLLKNNKIIDVSPRYLETVMGMMKEQENKADYFIND